MAVHKKYQALGRGLDALISDASASQSIVGGVGQIALDKITPNPDQPRRELNEDTLDNLTHSIEELGVIQPITLREQGDGTYMIIAGERRWRAALRAGLKTIPAYVKKTSDEEMRQMALVENIQREDLNAIEIALAFKSLMEEGHMTQEQTAAKVGMNRATVANYLRLLGLPAEIQIAVQEGSLEQGHARALLGLKEPEKQLAVFHELQGKGYSVRQVEKRVKAELERDGRESGKPHRKSEEEKSYRDVEQELGQLLEANVEVKASKTGSGKIGIAFSSHFELERLVETIRHIKQKA